MSDIFEEKANVPQTSNSIIVPISALHPFPNQPFKVRNDDAMDSLVESIRKNGLLNRIIIRPREAGGYEIVAGHRRVEAYRLLGYIAIEADLRTDLDDESAVLAMVETNLRQRPKLLPSERAWAYRMMRDVLLHQGERSDLKEIKKKRTRNEIADLYGEDPRQVNRYVRLTYLNSVLLEHADSGKLKVGAAVGISFLDEEVQNWIVEHYGEKNSFPNTSQIRKLRRLSEKETLTRAVFDEIMLEESPAKAAKNDFLNDLREEYFPDLMDADIKEKIVELVEEYFHRMRMEY